MSKQQHPFEGEAWVKEPGPHEYYKGRARGNWIILAAVFAFVAFVVILTMMKWDTEKFLDVSREREAREAALDALADQQRRLNETLEGQEETVNE